jgi:hypothetical protein
MIVVDVAHVHNSSERDGREEKFGGGAKRCRYYTMGERTGCFNFKTLLFPSNFI